MYIFIIYIIVLVIILAIISYNLGVNDRLKRVQPEYDFYFLISLGWPLVLILLILGVPFYLIFKIGQNSSKKD
jgi:uncharacterized BrkB/YihY/UPF0761 family membrane protein